MLNPGKNKLVKLFLYYFLIKYGVDNDNDIVINLLMGIKFDSDNNDSDDNDNSDSDDSSAESDSDDNDDSIKSIESKM